MMRRPVVITNIFALVLGAALFVAPLHVVAAQEDGTRAAAPAKSKVKVVGTIKSITGDTVAIASDAGADVQHHYPAFHASQSEARRVKLT